MPGQALSGLKSQRHQVEVAPGSWTMVSAHLPISLFVALIETDTISAVGQFEGGVSCVGYGYANRARWYRHACASI